MVQRNTFQQAVVLDTVRQLANHPTADRVYEAIGLEYPQVSRATVYRNLNKLADNGQLMKIRMFGSADRFDHTLAPHYHFVCESCGSFCDIDIPYQVQLNEKYALYGGRKINAHQIVFDGLCENCCK